MQTEIRLIDADTGTITNTNVDFQQHTDYAIEVVGIRWWMLYASTGPQDNTAIYELKVRRL